MAVLVIVSVIVLTLSRGTLFNMMDRDVPYKRSLLIEFGILLILGPLLIVGYVLGHFLMEPDNMKILLGITIFVGIFIALCGLAIELRENFLRNYK